MNKCRYLPAVYCTDLRKNGLYFVTAITLLLIQHTAMGPEQLHVGPCFSVCPFFFIQFIASMNENFSLETVFSAYTFMHHLELPSDSQLLTFDVTFGVVLSSGYRELLDIFLMLPFGGSC